MNNLIKLSFPMFLIFVTGILSGTAAMASTIVNVQAVNISSKAQTEVPMTFGQVFKKGAVLASGHLQAKINGAPIDIQVDRKATNEDGSLRHAIITVVVPNLPASGSQKITLSTGGSADVGKVSLSDLLGTSFDATVKLTIKGTPYTVSAKALLNNAEANNLCKPWGKQCNLWLQGPLVSEWVVSAPIGPTDAYGNQHLSVRFYIRAYAGATAGSIQYVRVNFAIENDWTFIPLPHNFTYDATLTTGGTTKTYTDIDHYLHTRWHYVLWWKGNQPYTYAKLDGTYLQATGAVPAYDPDVHPTDTLLNTMLPSTQEKNNRAQFGPMKFGNQTKLMGTTGAHPGIGPYPRWTSAYLTSMDYRAFRWMLANDDAAGTFDIFYRDKTTGYPVNVSTKTPTPNGKSYGDIGYPNKSVNGRDPRPDCDPIKKCGYPDDPKTDRFIAKPDRAHEPSVGYVSYLVTGDLYYLEQLQFWADWNEVVLNAGYRDYGKGLLHHNQVRAQAWDLRALGDATYATPDNGPLKSYFQTMLKNNAEWYKKTYLSGGSRYNPLGALVGPHAVVYASRRGLAPWQDDFFTWSIGHLVALGFDDFKPLLDWKARFPVGRMTTPGFCYIWASSYEMALRDDKNSPFYTTFKKVYQETIPDDAKGVACDSAEMTTVVQNVRGPGNQYQHGDLVGYPYSATGFPANMQPALAAAANAGIHNSAAAWDKFKTHSDPRVGASYDNYANYAIVPRRLVANHSDDPPQSNDSGSSSDGKRSGGGAALSLLGCLWLLACCGLVCRWRWCDRRRVG